MGNIWCQVGSAQIGLKTLTFATESASERRWQLTPNNVTRSTFQDLVKCSMRSENVATSSIFSRGQEDSVDNKT